MEVIDNSMMLCLSCMEEHDVEIIKVKEKIKFKGIDVEFDAIYEYCSNADEYTENEEMIRINDLAVKDAYRGKTGLLTSDEIKRIREKYDFSQKDFAKIFGWSEATITRYENHQVQDKAHDDILRKVDSDSKWLLDMLKDVKNEMTAKTYIKYHKNISLQYSKQCNHYLTTTIYSKYADIENTELVGNLELRLDKVVMIINYFARNVKSLYMVKLMKMLWYADNLNYKRHGHSITGMAYLSYQMGAVPVGYNLIVELEGVNYDVELYFNGKGYKFNSTSQIGTDLLNKNEMDNLDRVISELGHLNNKDIVERMHEEKAFKETEPNNLISYSHSKDLSF